MKVLKSARKALPLLAGLLFFVHAAWMYLYHLSMLVYSFFLIPIYLFLAVMLLRRHRDYLLALAVGLLLLARNWSVQTLSGMDGISPAWQAMSAAYLVGTILLLASVLINNIPLLRRFRVGTNRLWFVPGGVMLAAALGCCIYTGTYQEADFLSVRGWILSTFNLFCCPVTDALATLLTGRWLAVAAAEDLQPYLSMRGNILSEEEFQARKRELGLEKLRF